MIHPDWRLSLDHTPLTVNIIVIEECIQTWKCILVKNNKEEEKFITELINAIVKLDTENISNKEMLEQLLQIFANDIDRLWFKYSKVINMTKHSKVWWNDDCHRDLKKYMISKWLKDWKNFKNIVRRTKWAFFNQKIQELLNNKLGP